MDLLKVRENKILDLIIKNMSHAEMTSEIRILNPKNIHPTHLISKDEIPMPGDGKFYYRLTKETPDSAAWYTLGKLLSVETKYHFSSGETIKTFDSIDKHGGTRHISEVVGVGKSNIGGSLRRRRTAKNRR